MAEITTSTTKKKKGVFSRSRSRLSTRVDLTPMVDLGFLLITFFVFTTSLSEPKAMDLMETHDGEPKPVKQSGVMTMLLSKNHQIYYYYGELSKQNPANQILKSDFQSIRSLIVDKKRNTDLGYLMYIIKGDKYSTFGDHINLLDEMSICAIPGGHYSEVDITENELRLINSH